MKKFTVLLTVLLMVVSFISGVVAPAYGVGSPFSSGNNYNDSESVYKSMSLPTSGVTKNGAFTAVEASNAVKNNKKNIVTINFRL